MGQKWEVVELPDGTVVQYLSARLVHRLVKGWAVDVTLLVGDEVTTVRMAVPTP